MKSRILHSAVFLFAVLFIGSIPMPSGAKQFIYRQVALDIKQQIRYDIGAEASSAMSDELKMEIEYARESWRLRAPEDAPWVDFLLDHFPTSFVDERGQIAPLAAFHHDFFAWLWAITPGVMPDPWAGIWARGFSKSTYAELAVCYLAAHHLRPYGLYVSATQKQADTHVQAISKKLASISLNRAYPGVGDRLLSQYGHSLGWNRQRLRTANGFTLDSLGLMADMRGLKIEDDRPGFIVLDDVDDHEDSDDAVEKKVRMLTQAILPATTKDIIVIVIQNLVRPNGIVDRLRKETPEFLAGRIISGPYPAVENLEYEQRSDGKFYITAGRATWEGMPLSVCQDKMNTYGLSGFLRECQHDLKQREGGMFSHLKFRLIHQDEMPSYLYTVVAVDPAVEDKDESDCYGIQAASLGDDNNVYMRFSYEQRSDPNSAMKTAIMKAVELKADELVVETNQGGKTWEVVYDKALQELIDEGLITEKEVTFSYSYEKATVAEGSKRSRAQQLLRDYESGEIVHVEGTHWTLEEALGRFPKYKPFDLVDAVYWAWYRCRANGPMAWA